MKNVKIQTPEVVAYEVRWKSRDNRINRKPFTSELIALNFRSNLHNSANPPVWSEVYKIRTKKT